MKPRFALFLRLSVSSLWLLLVVHKCCSEGILSPDIISYPLLFIWHSLLIYRRSDLAIIPIVMLLLMPIVSVVEYYNQFEILFAEPIVTLLKVGASLIDSDMVMREGVQTFLRYVGVWSESIMLIIYLCILICYVIKYLRGAKRKEQNPSKLGVKRGFVLGIYLMTAVMLDSYVLSVSYKTTLAYALLALMLIPIPILFNRGRVKELFTRGEIAFIIMLVIFVLAYMCGMGLELKSMITTCTLPMAFYLTVNWYLRRVISYKEILPIVVGSIIFWCAQYTTNVVRVLLLLSSLGLMAFAVVRFVKIARNRWAGVGLYIIIALILPVFSLGYNPYSVLEAKRLWRFDKYYWARNGLLYVASKDGVGLRDRYGVILPVDEYDRVVLLRESMPYCKVRKDGKWQIYDIERRELVSEEQFEEVVPYKKDIYQLRSMNRDKYLLLPRFYIRQWEEQPAKVLNDALLEIELKNRAYR